MSESFGDRDLASLFTSAIEFHFENIHTIYIQYAPLMTFFLQKTPVWDLFIIIIYRRTFSRDVCWRRWPRSPNGQKCFYLNSKLAAHATTLVHCTSKIHKINHFLVFWRLEVGSNGFWGLNNRTLFISLSISSNIFSFTFNPQTKLENVFLLPRYFLLRRNFPNMEGKFY